MTKNKLTVRILRILVLLIFPLLLLSLTLKLEKNLSSFSQRSYDPEYVYLISGLTLGAGKLNVGHIDHPGTPIQIVVALITRIQQLITGENDYLTDVFLAPGQYIQTANYVFLSIIVGLLIVCGLLILRLTNNIALALFIQIAPFLYEHTMVDFTRLTPDSLMIIPVLIFVVYSIFLVQKTKEYSLKDVIGFSLLSGLGLAFKLNFIGFWFIPFFLFKGWKSKTIYLLGAIVAFLLFGFPLLFNLKFLWHWIRNLLMHSGTYGSGEANIVEWSVFFDNLNLLLKNYWLLYSIVFLSIINLVIHIIRKKTSFQNSIYRILLGLVICVLFHTILVSKHFAFRYMYNVLYATPFILYLNFEFLAKEYFFKKSIIFYLIGIFIGAYFIVDYNKKLDGMIGWTKDVADEKSEELRIIREKVGDAPFVIIPNNYDLMFEERGIIFGCAFAGGHKKLFQEKLVKMKPDFYLSEPTANKFWHWMELIPPVELKQKYNEFFLFVGKDYISNKDLFLEKLDCDYQLEELYKFEVSGDQLLSVKLFEN